MPKDQQPNKILRVRLGGGPYVRPDVHDKFDEWQRAGTSYGRIIDRLVDLAIETNFNPTD
jgi:hypothetical protein